MPHEIMSERRWDELRRLHAEGMGRNAIAREMGIQPSCISRTAAYLGLTFDRSKMRAATAARLADLEERRSLLAEDLVGDAEKLRAEVWQTRTYWDWGGKDHDYDERDHDTTPADKRALMSAAATAIDRSLKLAPAEVSSDVEGAKSMLGSLGAALSAFSQGLDAAEQAGAGEGGTGEA
ncbi:helix-turn-helix domain-containing protein [Streptomyces sp. SID10815]|uniref:helix-turn-helix domain-containing protein n=1 Tax=Streptomyces sp. SID10815 TaxID=2706027 RepID=UPI0019405A6D|nr:helix-turn-helix domain-containing protein [Streptomyces sp. SID10815]